MNRKAVTSTSSNRISLSLFFLTGFQKFTFLTFSLLLSVTVVAEVPFPYRVGEYEAKEGLTTYGFAVFSGEPIGPEVEMLLRHFFRGEHRILSTIGDPNGGTINVSRASTQVTAGVTFAFAENGDGTFTLDMPTGVSYVPGSFNLVSSTTFPATGPPAVTVTETAVIDPSAPVFNITGATGGGTATIEYDIVADCDAVQGTQVIDVDLMIGTVLSEGQISFDVLSAALTLFSHPTSTYRRGETNIDTIRVVNGGAGSLDSITFNLNQNGPLEVDSIVVNGITILPVNIGVFDEFRFGIPSEAFSDGTFDQNEEISIVRFSSPGICNRFGGGTNFNDFQDVYDVNFGVNGQECQEEVLVNGAFTFETSSRGGPVPAMTQFPIILANDCQQGTHRFALRNNAGPGEFNNLYNAVVDVFVLDTWNINGGVKIDSVFDIAGGRVPVTGGGTDGSTLTTRLRYNNRFDEDPDGPGGLEDLDNDGFFDDLAPGERTFFDVRFSPSDSRGCAVQGNSFQQIYRQGGGNDECGNLTFGATFLRFVRGDFGRVAVTDLAVPSTIGAGQTKTFAFLVDQTAETHALYECPDNDWRVELPLAPGVKIGQVRYGGNIIMDTMTLRDTFYINIPTVDGQLEFDVSTTEGVTPNPFNLEYQFAKVCSTDCPEGARIVGCYSESVNAPPPAGDCDDGGPTTTAAVIQRTSFGFTDAMMTERVDPADLSTVSLQRGLPCDSVSITASSEQIAGVVVMGGEETFVEVSFDLIRTEQVLDLFENGVFNVNGGPPQPLGAPAIQTVEDGTVTYIYALGPRFPGDMTTITLEGKVNFLTTLTNSLEAIPNLNIQFFSLEIGANNPAPVNPDDPFAGGDPRFTCNGQSMDFSVRDPSQSFLNVPTTFDPSGRINRLYSCREGFAFARLYVRGREDGNNIDATVGANIDYFPNEIRPIILMKSITLRLPPSINYVEDQFVGVVAGHRGDGYPTTDGRINFDLGDPVISANGRVLTFTNDGTWPTTDDSRNGYYQLAFNPVIDCDARGDENLIYDFTYTNDVNSANEDCQSELTKRYVERRGLVPPTLELEAINSPKQVDSRVECFDLNFTVTSNQRVTDNPRSFNTYIAFPGAGDNYTINTFSLSGSFRTVVDYDNGQLFEVGTVNKGVYAARLCVQLDECASGEIPFVLGYDCTEVPEDPEVNECRIYRGELLFNARPSGLQAEFGNQPTDDVTLCEELNYDFTMLSTSAADLIDPTMTIEVPQGMVIDTLKIEYPLRSGNIEIITPPDTVGTFDLPLGLHSMINDSLPGLNTSIPDTLRTAKVFLTFLTNCDFTSGDRIKVTNSGKEPCQEPAAGSGTIVFSDPVQIEGAETDYIAIFTSLDVGDSTFTCVNETVEASVLFQAGAGSGGAVLANNRDTLEVLIPDGLRYVTGSYACDMANSSFCPEALIVLDDGQRLLLTAPTAGVAVPEGNPATLEFTFDVNALIDQGCSRADLLTIRAVSTVGNASCATEPSGTCPNGIRFVAGQTSVPVTAQKAEIDSFEVAATEMLNDVYNYSGSFVVDSTVVPAGQSLTLEVFCLQNGIAGNTPVATEVFNGAINPMDRLNFMGTFTSNCPTDSLEFRIAPTVVDGTDQCVCEALVQRIETVPDCSLNLVPFISCGTPNDTSFVIDVEASWSNPNAIGRDIVVTFQGINQRITPTTQVGNETVQFTASGPAFDLPVTAAFQRDIFCVDSISIDLIACGNACVTAPDALGGVVLDDVNSDGADAGVTEGGRSNVLVQLYDINNTLQCRTYTNADGEWSCDGLNPDEEYRIEFSTPLDANLVSSFAGTANGTDVQFVTAGTCAVVFAVVDTVANPSPVQIGNYAWEDVNLNGTQDVCEPPLANIRVTLIDVATANVLAVTTTNTDGEYYFDNSDGLVDGGEYAIVFGYDGNTPADSNFDPVRDEFNVDGIFYSLTAPNASTVGNTDANDSDAMLTAVAGLMDYPIILYTFAGVTDHKLDVGLVKVPCEVTIDNIIVGDCVPATNGYQLEVVITYRNSGNIIVDLSNGVSRTLIPDGSGQDTLLIADLNSDGAMGITVSAVSNDVADCADTFITPFTAPEICTPCSITGEITVGTCDANRTLGDPLDDFFRVLIGASASGRNGGQFRAFIDSAGVETEIPGGPYNYGEIASIELPSDGVGVYTARVEDIAEAGCEDDLGGFTAPESCSPLCGFDIVSLDPAACSNGRYDLTIVLEYFNPSANEVVVLINGVAEGSHTLVMPDGRPGRDTFTVTNLVCTGDVENITVRVAIGERCEANAQFLGAPLDPTGYVYCVENGGIIMGGTVIVMDPMGDSGSENFNNIRFGNRMDDANNVITNNGTRGTYSWYATAEGEYSQSYNPPLGYSLVTARQSATPVNPTGELAPFSVGSGSTGNGVDSTFLLDYTAQGNPYFPNYNLSLDDPFVINNNIPVMSTAAINTMTVVAGDCEYDDTDERSTVMVTITVNYTGVPDGEELTVAALNGTPVGDNVMTEVISSDAGTIGSNRDAVFTFEMLSDGSVVDFLARFSPTNCSSVSVNEAIALPFSCCPTDEAISICDDGSKFATFTPPIGLANLVWVVEGTNDTLESADTGITIDPATNVLTVMATAPGFVNDTLRILYRAVDPAANNCPVDLCCPLLVTIKPCFSIGSTVFTDPNNNGAFDTDGTEEGIENVTLVLVNPGADMMIGGGDDTFVDTTTTSADGTYLFSSLDSGLYYVLIPVTENFGTGLPLGVLNQSSVPTSNADDQTDQDDNGMQDDGASTAVTSPVISLNEGMEPTTGTGDGFEMGPAAMADDTLFDANGDMTIDFGFLEEMIDVALRKKLIPTGLGANLSADYNETVEFEITVFNQGTVPLDTIEIIDYVPPGYTFVGANNTAFIRTDPVQLIGTDSIARYIFDFEPDSLAVGDSAKVSIFLRITGGVSDASDYLNVAEVTRVVDNFGTNRTGDDVDSTPDEFPANDLGGLVNSPSDDAIDGVGLNGGGVVGGNDPATDEDDADPATVPLIDVALNKILDVTSLGAEGIANIDEILTFNINVTNQGTLPVTNVTVQDDIPCGFDFFDVGGVAIAGQDDFTLNAGNLTATATIAGPLAPGQTGQLTIFLRVRDNAETNTACGAGMTINLTNNAEISGVTTADGVQTSDFDSEFNVIDNDEDGGGVINGNTDNVLLGNGTATASDGTDDPATDDDDRDPENTDFIDVALKKFIDTTDVATGLPPYSIGDVLKFDIRVFNQGNVVLSNIDIIDYMPAGLSFNAANNMPAVTGGVTWAANGANFTTTIPGPLMPFDSQTVSIFLGLEATTVSPNIAYLNRAEVFNIDATLSDGSIVVDLTQDADSPLDQNPGNNTGGMVNTPDDDNINGDGPIRGQDQDNSDPALAIVAQLSLGSTVFIDANNSGFQDMGELGIANVPLILFDETNGVVLDIGPDGELGSADDNMGLPYVTDIDGLYFFNNLAPGDYSVQIPATAFGVNGPLENFPISSNATTSGFIEIDPDTGDVDGDDNGLQAGGAGTEVSSEPISLVVLDEPEGTEENAPGGDQDNTPVDANGNMTLDFGFFAPVSLGDTVFVDLDEDGLQTEGEPGLGGVTVTLTDAVSGATITTDADGNTIPGTQETMADGAYSFDNLPPGNYIVTFDLGSLDEPGYYDFTTPNVGGNSNDVLDSDAVSTSGQTATSGPTGFLQSGSADNTIDAGVRCIITVAVAPPFTICSTGGIDLLTDAAVTPGSLGGFWTTPNGTGQFLDTNGNPLTADPQTMGYALGVAVSYRPSDGDKRRGEVTLTLTTNDPSTATAISVCPPVSDSVTITILNVDCGEFFWDGQ